MKRLLTLLFALSLGLQTWAQIHDPVKWSFETEVIDADEVELIIHADIEEGWHLYSQHVEGDPIPTSFTFFENEKLHFKGAVEEGTPQEEYDPNFETVLKFFSKKATFKQRIKLMSMDTTMLRGELEFMVCNDAMCLPPEWVDIEVIMPAAEKVSLGSKAQKNLPLEKSLWSLFFIAFISGFAALLTPCVFPMIPMTVSFFTKKSISRSKGISNAIIYGLSIIGIYVLLGVGVTAVFGPTVMNELATNVYFNIAFFLILIFFAASFLGAFEIVLPSKWVNKADQASDKKGYLGIFFMAFTLALVSFSCTGPIVGTLLFEAAARGNYLGPIIGMFGFSLAIALPFAFFAAFPGWLNSLPKSGGWLNSVKVVLGFLELALAFKFLSNADLVLQAHLLERETFIAIWIIIFLLLTMYLLGKLKLSHDSDLTFIPVPRLFFAILTGAFTLYMIPGLWGAPLKLINAFPPPMHYSESPMGVGKGGSGSAADAHGPEGTHLGPQGIFVFHDYEDGMAYARKVGKPVMLDFTGHACVNCRKMEEEVWSDRVVKNSLTKDVVLISLYVDERITLPKGEQYEVLIGNKVKKVRTTGDRWSVMQAKRYEINSQPYYVMLDHEENSLIEAANYQDYGNVELFKDWLGRGVEAFKNL
jgi:thiol:disulfide interchange protein DsbD